MRRDLPTRNQKNQAMEFEDKTGFYCAWSLNSTELLSPDSAIYEEVFNRLLRNKRWAQERTQTKMKAETCCRGNCVQVSG